MDIEERIKNIEEELKKVKTQISLQTPSSILERISVLESAVKASNLKPINVCLARNIYQVLLDYTSSNYKTPHELIGRIYGYPIIIKDTPDNYIGLEVTFNE